MSPQHPIDLYDRAFDFACRVVRLHQFLAKHANTERTLSSQLLRSGTSIGANLEEARAAQSKRDFIARCRISLKEARESHYWLRILHSTGTIPPDRISPIVTEAGELVAILTSIIKNTSNHIAEKRKP